MAVTLVMGAIGAKVTAHIIAAKGIHTLGFLVDPSMGTIGVKEVSSMVTKAQLFAGGIVIGVGGFMGTISGILRQLGLREEAMRRWKDVFWGTAMALSGPALVFLLATIIRFVIAGIGVVA